VSTAGQNIHEFSESSELFVYFHPAPGGYKMIRGAGLEIDVA
jgi:hypothetical protein